MTDEADNPACPAPTLEYGRPETQYGLTFETAGDGGVVITVPGTGGRYLHQRLSGVHTGTEMLLVAVAVGLRKLLGRPTPLRAVVAVTREGLSITEPGGGIGAKDVVRTWPLDQVGEVRANRYSKGVYVRIPGRENFDLLADLSRDTVERIGAALEEALRRLKK